MQGGAEDISRCLKTRSPNERTETGATPLHQAAANSTTPAVVTALVKAGADVNVRDEDGWTPEYYGNTMFTKSENIPGALEVRRSKMEG